MPITEAPFDVAGITVPDDLSGILLKNRDTPTFNGVLAKNRKIVTQLRRQAWPVAAAPDEEQPPEPNDAPEETPQPAPDPTPQFTEPGDAPEEDTPTADR
ncbi:hypothetical protein [Amycolatopsis sp. NPDC021455]|uniref:hypothetical protein n=1 Tax=Amycolatopsis sp. NPDC021455 TaxID=3154901 RepID=UPI0033C89E7A